MNSETIVKYLEDQHLIDECSRYTSTSSDTLCAKTTDMLTLLLTQMNESSQSQPELIGDKIKLSKGAFPKGDSFDYFPSEITRHIEALDMVGYYFTFTVVDRSYEVFIMSPLSRNDDKSFFRECAIKIYTWLSMAQHHAPRQCSQQMQIFLYLTDLKKEIPTTPDTHIAQEHVNTAFTTSCQEKTEMHLCRREEWLKVFFHETFHNMGLDFSGEDAIESNRYILTLFPVESDVRVFETYCEMWGEIIFILFSVYDAKKTIPDMIKEWCDKVKIEKVFSLFQCAKVLTYFDMEYQDLHEISENAQLVRRHQYKEKTHVLSYYIIKSIQMFFVDEYIEWCVMQNKGSLQFTKTPEAIIKYCDFIKSKYKLKEYRTALKIVEDWFSQQTPKEYQQPIMRTLRMTAHG